MQKTTGTRDGSGMWRATAPCAFVFALMLGAGLVAGGAHVAADRGAGLDTPARLGEALFFDVNLSKNRTQACATCHSPDHAFTDPREAGAAGRAVSLGDDGRSIGDRNTPSAAYASLAPKFHTDAKGKLTGGVFWDGRAATLEAQAEGPPLNPIEMGMPDKAAVVARLKENAAYNDAFERLYGKDVFADAATAFAAMASSIAAFERTDTFAPFDSKYDAYVRGEVQLSEKEELGRVLFFSTQFSNCSRCHKLNEFGGAAREPFSNYQFHNIGTPVNAPVRAVNGTPPGHVDHGLMENPAAADKVNEGKFRVPSLRNVAVTGPYMHNGVFKELSTVVKFYNKYNSKNPRHQINPETGQPWGSPEVAGNLSKEELESGAALDSRRVEALVAFLKTLTDKRYEHLTAP